MFNIKCTLILLASITTALAEPWPVHSGVYIPVYLERRMVLKTGGKSVARIAKGKTQYNLPPEGPGRSDSPPKKGDTHVSAKAVGPGSVATERNKNSGLSDPVDRTVLEPGQRATRETHDSAWSKAQARAGGLPPPDAGRQSAMLHPAKVEGTGQSGLVVVNAPSRGGYGHFKKEVDGQVIRDGRIRPGQSGVDQHAGSRPEEVKYTASASRGGDVFVAMNNSI